MFKSADPTRRIPTYLQPNTKENFVWQLKLTVVLIAGVVTYQYVQEKREQHRRAKTD